MSQEPTDARWGFGRLVIAGLAVICVVLGAINIWALFEKSDRPRAASEVPVRDSERPAATKGAASPVAAPQPGAQAMREGPQASERPTVSERESGVAPGTAGSVPGRAYPNAAPVTDDVTPTAGGGQPGLPGSPGGVDYPGAPAPAANGTGSGASSPSLGANMPGAAALAGSPETGSPAPVGGVPGSPVGVVALPPAYAQAPAVPAVPAAPKGTAADGSGARKPDENSAPEENNPDDDGSGADSTPPVLESLRFDPAQVEGGSVTTLTVQASDARSGLKSIWGEVRSPNRSAVLSFGSASVGVGGAFSFPIAIPRQAETGTWYVSWISLTDGAANTKLIQAASAATAPPGGTFAAFSSESDSTPPQVLQVSFDRVAVAPGEKNTIEVQARDDQSGLASVMGACQSPSKSALIWFNGVLNADTGTWVGEVPLPKNADCGNWIVQQLAVKDTAGNTTLLNADSPLLARASFQVASGSDCDFTAPTLEAFDLAPAIVASGTATEILVTARVYDVGSGAVSMTGWFEGPAPPGGQVPKNNFSCSPDPADPDAPWTCRVQVPQLAAKGTWKVGYIRVEDRAKNFRTYTSTDPVVSGRVFQVQ
jgi:hypothetical protein